MFLKSKDIIMLFRYDELSELARAVCLLVLRAISHFFRSYGIHTGFSSQSKSTVVFLYSFILIAQFCWFSIFLLPFILQQLFWTKLVDQLNSNCQPIEAQLYNFALYCLRILRSKKSRMTWCVCVCVSVSPFWTSEPPLSFGFTTADGPCKRTMRGGRKNTRRRTNRAFGINTRKEGRGCNSCGWHIGAVKVNGTGKRGE